MRRLNWIDEIILPLAVAVLHAAWLTLWLRWIDRFLAAPEHAIYPTASEMILLTAGGAFLTHFVLGRIADLNRARLAVLLSGLGAVLLTAWVTYAAGFPFNFLRGLFVWGRFVSPEFVGFMAAVYLWSRGILMGRTRIPHQMLEDSFYGGLAALACLLIINNLNPLVSRMEALWGMVIFFATGLGALALASLERARRKQKAATGTLPGLNRQWLGMVTAVIGAVIFGGLAVSGWIAPDTFLRFANIVGPYLDRGIYAVLYVVALIGFALAWLIIPVVQYLLLHLMQIPILLNLPDPARFMRSAEEAARAILESPAVRFAGRSALTLVIATMVLALLWWSVRRFSHWGAKDVDETRESILSGELLLDQLRQLFALRPRPAGPGSSFLDLAGPPDDPRLIIRRAYQGLLTWTRTFTVERGAGQTPAVFARSLTRLLPESAEAISVLTAAYERARYAAEPPPLAEAEQARRALEQLKNIGRPARLPDDLNKGAA